MSYYIEFIDGTGGGINAPNAVAAAMRGAELSGHEAADVAMIYRTEHLAGPALDPSETDWTLCRRPKQCAAGCAHPNGRACNS